jgi:hypothetical protein
VRDPNISIAGEAKPTEWDSNGKIICRSIANNSIISTITEDTDFTKVYVNISGGCVIGTRDFPITLHLTSHHVDYNFAHGDVIPSALVTGGIVGSWNCDYNQKTGKYTLKMDSWVPTSYTDKSPDTTINGQFYGTIYSNAHVHLNTCAVVGRIESYSIDSNSNTYLFIKEWK